MSSREESWDLRKVRIVENVYFLLNIILSFKCSFSILFSPLKRCYYFVIIKIKDIEESPRKCLFQDSANERVHFNLGMLAMDDRDTASAEHWFRRAVQLKDDFRSALFNLALLLADDHRPLEAAPFLNQLVRFHPDHVKGLILLGDCLLYTSRCV